MSNKSLGAAYRHVEGLVHSPINNSTPIPEFRVTPTVLPIAGDLVVGAVDDCGEPYRLPYEPESWAQERCGDMVRALSLACFPPLEPQPDHFKLVTFEIEGKRTPYGWLIDDWLLVQFKQQYAAGLLLEVDKVTPWLAVSCLSLPTKPVTMDDALNNVADMHYIAQGHGAEFIEKVAVAWFKRVVWQRFARIQV